MIEPFTKSKKIKMAEEPESVSRDYVFRKEAKSAGTSAINIILRSL